MKPGHVDLLQLRNVSVNNCQLAIIISYNPSNIFARQGRIQDIEKEGLVTEIGIVAQF